MDARPQRPRALRVTDENMAPPAVTANGALTGKTLHQRTKSVPAFSSVVHGGAKAAGVKKVLGEVDANSKVAKRATDDSEIQKASPGKFVIAKDEPMVMAQFARRGLTAGKAASTQNVITATKTQLLEQTLPKPIKKPIGNASTKVLRDHQPVQHAEVEVKRPLAQGPVHQGPAAAPKAILSQPPAIERPVVSTTAVTESSALLQEVRKTESVPLRDEQVARPSVAPPSESIAGPSVEQQYLSYYASSINANPNMMQAPVTHQHAQTMYTTVDDGNYFDDHTGGYTTGRSFAGYDSTGGITTVLAPKEAPRDRQEIAAAKDFVEATRTPEDVEDEQWDTSMVAEYGEEIFAYMRQLEVKMTPNPFYMDKQTEIQWSMRAVLMDWIVQVHQRFNLLPETLFLTANYIDRFLSAKIVSLGKLQLVGATAIFVAAKYEEVQCPTIQEIIYMVDGGYTAEELLKAERFMLSMLQFELGWPGPMSFLRRISKADDYDLETRTLAKYFLEVTIMDERFVGCTPSFLAAGAHCMARLMLRKGEWSPAHVHYSGYTYAQLRQLLQTIVECCESPKQHHQAVFDKYTDKRFKRASAFVSGEMMKGFTVPAFFIRGASAGPFDAAQLLPTGW